VVDDDDWEAAVLGQYSLPASAKTNVNAFVGNRASDRPAILKADRGTISTAIHESMHRYSMLNVLHTFGAGLNEGITEYFTRKIANADGTPATQAGPERDNYDFNIYLVREMLRILGTNTIAQETVLAEIYFSGDIGKVQSKFKAAWAAADSTLTAEAQETKWTEFVADLETQKFFDAADKLPPA
jgi:hypothetical protein